MNKRARMVLFVSALLLATVGAGVAWAGSSDHTDIPWQVLSGGGSPAVSSSGRVALDGSLGQTAIGPGAGGTSALGAGYWYGLGIGRYPTYLPLVLRHR